MGALTDALKNFGPFVSPLIFTLFPVCLTLLIISVVWSRKILKSMSVNNEIDYKNTSFNWIFFKVLNSVFQTTVESAIEKIDILVKSHYTKKESSKK